MSPVPAYTGDGAFDAVAIAGALMRAVSRRCLVHCLLCALLEAGISLPVQARDDDANLISSAAADMPMTHAVRGSLIEGQRDHKYVWLEGGTTYLIHATGDIGTRDVDLRLFSPEGLLVTDDELAGEWSRLVVRPARSGQYRIQVVMAQCDDEPCDYVLVAVAR